MNDIRRDTVVRAPTCVHAIFNIVCELPKYISGIKKNMLFCVLGDLCGEAFIYLS